MKLNSGGYLVINPTEAGFYRCKLRKIHKAKNVESTALDTNLEAAEEIASKLR